MLQVIQRAQRGSFKLFRHHQRRVKKGERFRCSTRVGKPRSEAVAFVNGLRLAARHSPHNRTTIKLTTLKLTTLKLTTVQHASSSASAGSKDAKKESELTLRYVG